MEFFTNHIASWLVTSIIGLLTIFSDKIVERIRFAINKADLRIKYYEELATDLSLYIFWSEVYLERFEKKWTKDQDDLEAIAGELNVAMTTLRKKEFVYKSWINRYWKEKERAEFADIYVFVKKADTASHAFNDAGHEKEKAKKYRDELELLQQKVNKWLLRSAS